MTILFIFVPQYHISGTSGLKRVKYLRRESVQLRDLIYLCVFFQAPTLYDDRDPIDLQMSKIGTDQFYGRRFTG